MSLVGRAVRIVVGPWRPDVDAVVKAERPYVHRPAPWTAVPSTMYELHWPDGTSTWHQRHEFEPTGRPDVHELTAREIAARYLRAEYGPAVSEQTINETLDDMTAEHLAAIVAAVQTQPDLIKESGS